MQPVRGLVVQNECRGLWPDVLHEGPAGRCAVQRLELTSVLPAGPVDRAARLWYRHVIDSGNRQKVQR
jgi:hypothetical protein